MQAFIIAANSIISKPWLLDQKPGKQKQPVNMEVKRLNQEIKELEDKKQYSSKVLFSLILKRSAASYKTAQIKDYEHTTEKIKQAFEHRELLKEFDDELFLTVIKHITVYADNHLTFEFINGLTIEGTY